MSGSPPGLDLGRLARYLDTACLLSLPVSAELIVGGRSNLTYLLVDAAGERLVLRRPPMGHVLATAHDMAREYRVMSALRPTAVPVPDVVALCTDPQVIGAPFYLMRHVPGRTYRHAADLMPLGAQRTRAICERMIDTLAALHAVDPAAVGLSTFGHPEGFLRRQVRRWKQQFDASRSRDIPGLDDLHDALERDIPAESAASVVHGDYRLDNLLVDASDEIAAVLDWEMATLGDPFADIALLMAYTSSAATIGAGPTANDVSRAPGFPSPAELLDRYAARSGRQVPPMGFYLGLAYFKIAGILEGIHYRHSQGQTVGGGFEEMGRRVPAVVAAGLDAVKES